MSRLTPLNACVTRRALVINLSVAAIAASAPVLLTQRSRAAEAPHLDVKDPAAIAVGYVEDAGRVDPKKYPTYVKGSDCENCLLLQGASGSAYRPCNLFPGKLVAAAGWCSGWAAEI
jgi:High potential iron-sulfur protein